MTLAEYINDVRLLLKDPFGNFYTTADLTNYINRARKQVALDGQCVRILVPSQAYLTSIAVTVPGAGYSTATVTISGPDGIGADLVTATATATTNAGQVTAINITNPGRGYVTPPTITIDGNGLGAEAAATLSPHMTTALGVDRYQFSTVTAIARSEIPGVGDVIGIQSIAVSWGTMRPVLDRTDFSSIQAYGRSYGSNYQSWPAVWAQHGQGALGSFFIFPAASQVEEMQIDCYCQPMALSPMQTIDLIPDPWTDAVGYYSAYYAYLQAQRMKDAQAMLSLYRMKMMEARVFVSPSLIPTMYPGL